MTAKNAMPTSAAVEPAASASVALARRSLAIDRAWRRIQTIMNVTAPTASAAMIALQALLLAVRQLLVDELQGHADDDADRDRRRDADPDRPHRPRPPRGPGAGMPR